MADDDPDQARYAEKGHEAKMRLGQGEAEHDPDHPEGDRCEYDQRLEHVGELPHQDQEDQRDADLKRDTHRGKRLRLQLVLATDLDAVARRKSQLIQLRLHRGEQARRELAVLGDRAEGDRAFEPLPDDLLWLEPGADGRDLLDWHGLAAGAAPDVQVADAGRFAALARLQAHDDVHEPIALA